MTQKFGLHHHEDILHYNISYVETFGFLKAYFVFDTNALSFFSIFLKLG